LCFLAIESDKSQQKCLKIPKGVIRIRKSKKNRQHNGQTTIYKIMHIKHLYLKNNPKDLVSVGDDIIYLLIRRMTSLVPWLIRYSLSLK